MSEDNAPAEAAAGDGAADELEALRTEVQALKDQVLRFAADAENTRRRAEREMNDARAYAITKFARDLLGVADTFDRALAAVPPDADGPMKNFVVGVEMTAKELLAAFEKNGLTKIDPAKGEKFDPHKHQAMMEQPDTEVAPGGVVQVLQAGYELLGRLVRPAMVVVAPKAAGAAASQAEGPADPCASGGGGPANGAMDAKA